MAKGNVLVAASGKGGTGKTSVVAGVGACLASLGKKVLLVDCDVGMRNLDLVLGLHQSTALDLFDVLLYDTPVESALAVHPEFPGLSLLSCPGLPPENWPGERDMKDLVDKLRRQYDFILLDAPAGLGQGLFLAACAADTAVLVSTLDETALRDGQLTARALRERGLAVKLIVNRVRPRAVRRGDAKNVDQAMDQVGAGLLGVIPEDPRVSASANRGRAAPQRGYESAARAYLRIARRLNGEEIPLKRLKGGAI